jgi:hypothetical protein
VKAELPAPAPRPTPYRVGQEVACPRAGRTWVGTIRRIQWTGTAWRYHVQFGEAWREWVGESAIVGVQAELPLDGSGPQQ